MDKSEYCFMTSRTKQQSTDRTPQKKKSRGGGGAVCCDGCENSRMR